MSEQINGVVKWYNSSKGYGFIICKLFEEDIFFHKSEIINEETLKEDDEVIFEKKNGEKGVKACKICKVK